jgi:hypothetical protein
MEDQASKSLSLEALISYKPVMTAESIKERIDSERKPPQEINVAPRQFPHAVLQERIKK